ncbi:MAG: hypothetical protein ACREPM_00795 [Gemmatimonadaceae bacterium]
MIKAFTNALRRELEEGGVPISVTLIKPSSIDTPLFAKAKSFLGVEPRPIPPVYAPDVVARAILVATERPVFDIVVGGLSRVMSLGEGTSSRTADRVMAGGAFDSLQTQSASRDDRADNLHEAVSYDGGERGNFDGHVRKRSAYTSAVLCPKRAAVMGTMAAAVAFAARRALMRRGADTSAQAPPRE